MTPFFKELFRSLLMLLRFLPIYLREMTLSNIRVAGDALRPRPKFSPGFVEVDVRGYSDLQRWGAACLISMTPGTLSLDLKGDELLVHSLYLSEPEATKKELETLIENAFGIPNIAV